MVNAKLHKRNDYAEEVVILGMFDLTHLGSARAVRIHNLFHALRDLTPTTLLSGSRMARRRAVLRYLREGGLSRTRALYVEASNGPANELDLLLIRLAKTAGIPVLVFIPDAYQLFPDIFPRDGLKVKILDLGWRFSISVYIRLADILLFPSWGLADCFRYDQSADLLWPGGLPDREFISPPTNPFSVIYVGPVSSRDGTDLLVDVMQRFVNDSSVRLTLVTADDSAIRNYLPKNASWLTVEHKTFYELPALIQQASVTVIPRRINAYHDLAMPVKLFDYMSYGRPVITTACREIAQLVNELEAGVVVEDNFEGLTQGILQFIEEPDLCHHLGWNAYQAVQTAHGWSHRAVRLLELIEKVEQRC